jgi:TolB protein
MNPDGTERKYVVQGTGPAVSSDGRWLAFERVTEQFGNDIFVMSLDNGRIRQLTDSPGYDREPTWSPDGTQIAFSTSRHGVYNFQLYVVNADETGLRRLTTNNFNDSDPKWSPDGRRLAFHRMSTPAGEDGIYLLDMETGVETLLVANASDQAWAPDGSMLAFVTTRDGNPEIYTVGSDGSGLTRITSNAFFDWEPSWSPDGLRIVFTSARTGNPDIYMMNADGSSQVNLTNEPDLSHYSPHWSPVELEFSPQE